ncbi:LysR family transcriptional regulator [Bradyrhizobium cenepequi]|uniref:LysR family transcriptional regulator n=1 Tax=Bradyrhizobium cenepequi TaxID=2821403 RepID=UPI001CE38D63|nr:LysR family transcriptional regulator [Bradyrhizobium cenepequi]MCA6112378.1 LysR family transcriptional regulator [Bradyrhizobium cenepequi]
MRETLSLDDLRLIRAIGDAGTLTGAARLLRIDHSTAFRRLGAIERRLGTKLFERARDGYTPTSAGEMAIATGAHLLAGLADLEQRLAGEDLRPTGTVRVTTTDALVDLMAPVLAELRADHPGIAIELNVANQFFTLTKREADIALRPAAEAPEQLAGRRLANVATAPYASSSYLRRNGKKPLSEYHWLGFDDSLSHLRSARWMAAHLPAEQIVFRADSLLALRSAARAGLGVAALPCYFADKTPELRRVESPIPEMEGTLWLLTHPDLRKVARIRTVLDVMAGALSRQRGLIEGREGKR